MALFQSTTSTTTSVTTKYFDTDKKYSDGNAMFLDFLKDLKDGKMKVIAKSTRTFIIIIFKLLNQDDLYKLTIFTIYDGVTGKSTVTFKDNAKPIELLLPIVAKLAVPGGLTFNAKENNERCKELVAKAKNALLPLMETKMDDKIALSIEDYNSIYKFMSYPYALPIMYNATVYPNFQLKQLLLPEYLKLVKEKCLQINSIETTYGGWLTKFCMILSYLDPQWVNTESEHSKLIVKNLENRVSRFGNKTGLKDQQKNKINTMLKYLKGEIDLTALNLTTGWLPKYNLDIALTEEADYMKKRSLKKKET